MTAIAERIEERLRILPRLRAARLEKELLRVLESVETPEPVTASPPPYRTRPLLRGLHPGYSYDNVAELLADAEGED